MELEEIKGRNKRGKSFIFGFFISLIPEHLLLQQIKSEIYMSLYTSEILKMIDSLLCMSESPIRGNYLVLCVSLEICLL